MATDNLLALGSPMCVDFKGGGREYPVKNLGKINCKIFYSHETQHTILV